MSSTLQRPLEVEVMVPVTKSSRSVTLSTSAVGWGGGEGGLPHRKLSADSARATVRLALECSGTMQSWKRTLGDNSLCL